MYPPPKNEVSGFGPLFSENGTKTRLKMTRNENKVKFLLIIGGGDYIPTFLQDSYTSTPNVATTVGGFVRY